MLHNRFSMVRAFIVGLATCGVLFCHLAAASAQMPPGRVAVAEVQEREITLGRTFVGTVAPKRISTVGSAIEGQVILLRAREGDRVAKGDVLAQLRTEQLQLQLAAAEAQLQALKHVLDQLKISLPEEITQAEARREASKALMDFAVSKLNRSKPLFERHAISEDELQERRSTALAAKEKYRENLVAHRLAAAVAPIKLREAEAKVAAQKEETGRLQDDLEQHTIRAPFDGYITQEQTEVGQWVSKGDPIVEMVEVDEIDIEIPVLENLIAELQVGMKAQVTLGALPGRRWEAPVLAIVPKADVRSRTFPVKVRLENESGPGGVLLKPGMFARVTLAVGAKGPAKLVPKDALVLGGEWPIVYVVGPMPEQPPAKGPPADGPSLDGVARKVSVELGAAIDELIVVRSPLLKAGDLVVTEGNERLFEGQPLIITNRDQLPSQNPAAKPAP